MCRRRRVGPWVLTIAALPAASAEGKYYSIVGQRTTMEESNKRNDSLLLIYDRLPVLRSPGELLAQPNVPCTSIFTAANLEAPTESYVAAAEAVKNMTKLRELELVISLDR